MHGSQWLICFPLSPFGTIIICYWPTGSTVAYDLCCNKFLNFIFYSLIVLHCDLVWLWTSHLLQTERHIFSGVHLVWIQCWVSVNGKMDAKVSGLYLFCHHLLNGDTICWVSIPLSMRRQITIPVIFYSWFKVSDIYTFVECKVLVFCNWILKH